MARYNDNAPIGNTCPIIDNIIGLMETAKNEAEYISKHTEGNYSDEANTILSELVEAIKEMETIREANSELRTWGNEEYDRAEYAEGERDDVINEKEVLEEKVSELKDRVEELEGEITELQEIISNDK